nr:hypothetical protein [Tanacetum cinerariifolium]
QRGKETIEQCLGFLAGNFVFREYKGRFVELERLAPQVICGFCEVSLWWVNGVRDMEVLMIDWLSIVETDKMIHTMETDIVKLVIEIKSFGMGFDEFDKETVLLSSDEFHVALSRVAPLGINYGVERGLRMGHTDADFEMAVQKVSNFQVGVKADFDKALVDFPTTPFPFLGKVVATAGGTLSDMAKILPDKFACSATPVSTAPSSVNEAPDQVPF